MADSGQLLKLSQSPVLWNQWRDRHPDLVPDLAGADLSKATLSGANLNGADLRGANLSSANLLGAWLYRANLEGADLGAAILNDANLTMADVMRAKLQEANLSGASLGSVNLSESDLSRANLDRANLMRANISWVHFDAATLRNADMWESVIGWTSFADNDLSSVKRLESVRHVGPSSIGIDTIYRSQGKIPISFLRGCGVPENFITYMPSLVTPGAIQFYSCFISYSTKDQKFADRLYADLQNKGVRCWFAPHDVQGGKKLHEQIDEAIRRYERLLLILSPNSMSSKWVKTEIRNARKREVAEKKRVLFPVRLASYEALRDWKLFDGDEGEDLATEIREFYIPDFSEWKHHDLYAREFEKLLRALRTEGGAAPSG